MEISVAFVKVEVVVSDVEFCTCTVSVDVSELEEGKVNLWFTFEESTEYLVVT